MASNTLRVRKLPRELTDEEKIDLLTHFGAINVRCIGTKNVTAFAKFESVDAATVAMRRLHQLNVLGHLLCVDYATEQNVPEHDQPAVKISNIPKPNEPQDEGTSKYKSFLQKLNAWSLGLDLTQPPPAHLRYQYPPPTMPVLANIARAMCAIPRFYTQVLHLMNRMNLPSPFHETREEHRSALEAMLNLHRPMDRTSSQHDEAAPEAEDMQTSSTESEMESEEDTSVPREHIPTRLPAKRPRRTIKRPKLQKKIETKVAKNVPAVPVSDVFELQTAGPGQSQRKIELRVTSQNLAPAEPTGVPASDSGGFGVLFPPVPEPMPGAGKSEEGEEKKEEEGATISLHQLRANRLSDRDLGVLPVFKGYQAGSPSCRLYVKNLTKTVTARDLHFIFRAFLQPTEESNNMFDIRHMTEGRMKGQAFITYPSIKEAQTALKETNGYLLQDKPLVVQFARSAKPTTAP